jgi:hypothetical protein
MKHTLAVLLIAASITTQALGQNLKMPQASSAQTITQEFGLGKITVSYSRPNTKGRVIFGQLEPYGAVWRTGANSATVLTFSDEVKIQGQTVPAGEYGLFTIPGKEEWTIILNKTPKQWGAYTYKESDDFLRIRVRPAKLKEQVETFTIQFSDVYPATAKLQLLWEKTLVSLDLVTDIDSRIMAGIDQAVKGEKVPYYVYSQAAIYYYENGKDLNKALEWISAAEAAEPKTPWLKLWKGRIQLKNGDKKGAAATAQAAIKAAQEQNNDEYVRLSKELLKQAS